MSKMTEEFVRDSACGDTLDFESILTSAMDSTRCREILDLLPVAIYTTDAQGRLTHFNKAAVAMSGRTPELGTDRWCVTWKLYHPDGRPMRHDECPMAVALKEGRPVRGAQAIADRPDGTRFWFEPYPTPLFDSEGNVTGGINMLLDITERHRAQEQLASEARSLSKLNEISSQLWRVRTLRQGLDEMLAATIELLGADFGNVQLLDTTCGVLLIEAQRGFKQPFLDFFREVAVEDESACGRALRSGRRIVIHDVESDATYAPMREVARAAGYRGVQSTPLIGRDGAPLGMLSTHWRHPHSPNEHALRRLDLYARQAVDFIERKRVDEALHASEERYRQTLALMPAAVYCCDASGVITYYNERAAQLWGRAPELGDSDERFCGSEQMILPDGTPLPHDQCPMALALTEGRSFRDAEINVRHPDGKLVQVMVNIAPIRDADGQIRGAINAFHDISAIKRAESSLRESEERFRAFISTTSDVVYRMSPDWTEMRHLQEREFIADTLEPTRTWLEKYIHPDDHQEVRDAIERAIQTKSKFELEHRVIRRDGSLGWTLSRAIPVFAANGQIQEWFGAAADISKRKEAEEGLRVREKLMAGQRRALELAINDAPLADSLGAIVATAIEALGGNVRAAVYLSNQDKTALHHVVGMCTEYASAVDGFPIGPDSLSCGLAVHTGKPVLTHDVQEEPLWKPWLWLAERTGFRGCWSIPIHTSRERYIGTLAIYSSQPRVATERDVEICSLLTHTASLIIARHTDSEVRTKTEIALRESSQINSLLSQTAARLLESSDPQLVVEQCCADVLRFLDCQFFFNYLLDVDANRLRLNACAGIPAEEAHKIEWLDFGQAVCGCVARDCERIIAENIAEQPDPRTDLVRSYGVQAYCCHPLMIEGRLIGTLSFGTRRRTSFTSQDIDVMRAVTDLVAMAMNRLQTEQFLRESQERFRMLADNMAQLAWTCDTLGNVTWYNKRWLEYTGLSFEEMKGWDWSKVQHPDHLDRVVANIKHSAQSGEPWEDTFPLRNADGNYRWFLSRAVPIRNDDGKIVCWFGTNTDVTEQREAEEALKEADIRKDEFLATLAHELRGPLAPVRNMLEVMKRGGVDDELMQQARDTMERQLSHMVRLVDDLLDISRISRNKIDLKRERVELASVVSQAVEATRMFADSARQELTVALPPNPIYLHADAVRLAQVFGNLLNNACKYTPPGGQIWLTAEARPCDVVVKIRDTGVGIASDKLTSVFEMFSQVESSLERSHGGLGIGLALVKRLVEMHEGSVEAWSEGPGRGSEFIVRLPVPTESEEPQPRTEPNRENVVSARRILVVDDNRDSATSLAMLLKLTGNDTRTAHDGLEAVEQAEAYQPDVILLDIGLPKLNGYEACRRIRAQSRGDAIHMVALTGWGQDDDRRKSREAGFDDHLVKPVEYATLAKLLFDSRANAESRGLEDNGAATAPRFPRASMSQ